MPVSQQESRSAYSKDGSLKFHFHLGRSGFSFLGGRSDLTGPGEYLLNQRKEAISEREVWLTRQKEATVEKDFALAKFCKEKANYYQKRYRAACWLIPHVC